MIDKYLEKPYWVIDILPKQVPINSRGQYFKIAHFYRNEPQYDTFCRKFFNILMKLNCYVDIDAFLHLKEWIHNPAPELLFSWIRERKLLYILLKSLDAMISVDGDDLYMTLYNPTDDLLEFNRTLASSEGLYVWKPEI